MCNADECVWVQIPGTNVTIQVRSGIPAVILPAFVARYNQLVEPVRDPDTACWTLTNNVSTSNHPAGVAVDINWDSHPFHAYNTFGDRLPLLRQVQQEFRGCIQWGGDWGGDPQDEMHHELAHPEGYIDQDTKQFVLAVDQRLIDLANDLQAGYLGIYVPGAPTPPPPAPGLSKADGYAVLIIQEGQRRGITPRGIQIALATALVESNITIYANEAVPESMSIPHDAVGSDAYSVGIFQQQVRDTGNGWWWGDAATCMDPTSSAGLFYDRLAKLDYNGSNSPGSYAQAVQSSAFPDRYDQRFNDAVAIYNRLATGAPPAPPPLPGDDMALVPQAQWDALYQAYMNDVPSLSPLRHLGEGNVGPVHRILRNIDGSEHVEIVKLLASYGHPPTLALLREVAAADPAQYPDRQDDRLIAQAILADVTSTPAAQAVTAAPTAAPVEPRVVYLPSPTPPSAPAALPAPVESSNGAAPTTTGQAIGALFDALESMRLADALPIEARAPLSALISVLQTKNGSQL